MDLQGKTCVITGATSGIGEATAHDLASRGASLALVCRNREKGEHTLRSIRSQAPDADVRLFLADLGSQAEIRRVAEELLSTYPEIHLLVNNAGVVNVGYSETEDGIETTFAVNHLAYFLLTNLLLDRLRASAPARIVNVASDAHKFVRAINFDDLGYKNGYSTMRVYGHSKLANVLFTRELARRLDGSGVTANAVHPGAVATGLGANNGWWAQAIMNFVGLFFKSAEGGAATSLYVATSPEVDGLSGKYFASCKEQPAAAWGRDDEAAARLWAISEELTQTVRRSAAGA